MTIIKTPLLLNYYTYLHTSSKNWVTFVHGAGGSSSIWFKQVRAFKKQFNVLILDLRGHGDSKPSLKDTFNPKYTFDAITDDIPDADGYKAYIAGPPVMVESVVKRLKSLGIQSEDCHADAFYTEAEK